MFLTLLLVKVYLTLNHSSLTMDNKGNKQTANLIVRHQLEIQGINAEQGAKWSKNGVKYAQLAASGMLQNVSSENLLK